MRAHKFRQRPDSGLTDDHCCGHEEGVQRRVVLWMKGKFNGNVLQRARARTLQRELSRLVQFTHECGVGRLETESRARSLQIYLGVTFLANLLLRFVTLQVRQSGLVNADYDYDLRVWIMVF